jgi:hypothetical protein
MSITTIIALILGLAYIAGAGYASYMVYNAIVSHMPTVPSIPNIPGQPPIAPSMNSMSHVPAILAAIGTMIGFLSIPLGFVYYKFLFGVYNREGMWGVLPFIAAERLMRY